MSDRREKKSHIWDRDEHDWYVEPKWCSERLFEAELFEGSIWDPACGLGRIVEAAGDAGYQAAGSDLVVRSGHCSHQVDFRRATCPLGCNIVANPPFGIAEDWLKISLGMAIGKVALLLPLTWLSGMKRSLLLEQTPLTRVYILTPRPSMPPGAVILADEKPGGGTKDFAWFIWEQGKTFGPEVRFLRRERAA